MDQLEKRNYLINEIVNRKKNPGAASIQLNFTGRNKLKTTKEETAFILDNLTQLTKTVVIDPSSYENLDSGAPSLIALALTSHSERYKFFRKSITLQLAIGFDNWYQAFKRYQEQSLESLSRLNVEKVYSMILDINDQLEIVPTSSVSINLFTNRKFPAMKEFIQNPEDHRSCREDALDYLKAQGVIYQSSIHESENQRSKIKVEIDINQFPAFKEKIAAVYHAKYPDGLTAVPSPMKTSSKTNESLYRITFSARNEIILNDLIVLSKPNLNSENGDVFSYVFKRPKQAIKKADIEKHLNQSIGKDFHKIVENWGFTGDLRKAFFHVANDSIIFNNPITQTDFDQLGIPPLKITKK